MPQTQKPDECDHAYNAGKQDARNGTQFRVEFHTCKSGSVAYARGWLDGPPPHSEKLARIMASPVEE
jgi:hypothetical protein